MGKKYQHVAVHSKIPRTYAVIVNHLTSDLFLHEYIDRAFFYAHLTLCFMLLTILENGVVALLEHATDLYTPYVL